MRFLGVLVTAASVWGVGMVSAGPLVQADFGDAPTGGSTIILNLQLDGTYYDDSGAKRRLCDDGFSFFSTTTPPSIEMPGAPGADYRRTVDDVEQVPIEETFVRRDIDHISEMASRTEDIERCVVVEGEVLVPGQRNDPLVFGSHEELEVVREALVVGVVDADERFVGEVTQPLVDVHDRL